MNELIIALHEEYLRQAIGLAQLGMDRDEGGPFGAVVVKDGEVIGRGNNKVTSSNDPTAHAEVVAMRDACRSLGSFQLEGCTLYTSCEPCPMCFGAIYWARPDAVYYACDKHDASQVGFDDQFIYDEIAKPESDRSIDFVRLNLDEGAMVFNNWATKENKVHY